MSLKSIAERLAEELAKTGKKLDRTVLHLAEAVDNIVGSIPKGQLTEKGFDSLPPTARKAMVDGLLKVTDAAPTPGAKKAIAQEYLNTFRIKFGEGKAGDDAFDKFGKQFAKALDEEMKGGAKPDLIRQAGGPVTNPRAPTPASTEKPPIINVDARRKPGTKDMGDAQHVEPTFEEPVATGGGAGGREPPPASGGSSSGKIDKAAARAAKAAESVISNSLTDMHTVRTTNGKMPKQAFFAELQDALREKGLLLVTREGELAKTPEQVYNRIANRTPVAESEIRVLAEYFGRFHNDAKAARELAAQPAVQNLTSGRGVAGIAEAVVRRIPVSEGGRTSATIAQSHAWVTGETSFIRNRISAFQEAPVRSSLATVSYGALAFVAFAGQQTYETIQDFQNPNYLGREIMAVVTPDNKKEIDDYVEYAHARFNSNVPEAMKALKKYYGIEKIDDSNKENVVEALLKGPRPPFDPSPDITQSLIMFVSQRVYGKPVASTADLKGLQNDQITKGKETAEAEATKKEAGMKDNAQSAMNSQNPAPMLDIGGNSGSVTTPDAQRPAYSQYEVDGETFDNRLKGFSYNNPGLYNALADVFKKVTKKDVKPEQELTSANVMTQEESIVFAEEAKTMLSAQKIDPERAEKMVKMLTEPVSGIPAYSR